MALSVERQTLGFGLSHDLTVHEFKPPCQALHGQHGGCLGFSLSLSLSAPPLLTPSLSLKINTLKMKKPNFLKKD